MDAHKDYCTSFTLNITHVFFKSAVLDRTKIILNMNFGIAGLSFMDQKKINAFVSFSLLCVGHIFSTCVIVVFMELWVKKKYLTNCQINLLYVFIYILIR